MIFQYLIQFRFCVVSVRTLESHYIGKFANNLPPQTFAKLQLCTDIIVIVRMNKMCSLQKNIKNQVGM